MKNRTANIWPLMLLRVEGDSMLPTYKTGDLLVGWKWFRPRVGQVVVARSDMMLVKRILRVEADKVWLEGDNKQQSRDSRRFGFIDAHAVEAVILFKLAI